MAKVLQYSNSEENPPPELIKSEFTPTLVSDMLL